MTDSLADRIGTNTDVRKRMDLAKQAAAEWNLTKPIGTRIRAELGIAGQPHTVIDGRTTSAAYTVHTVAMIDVISDLEVDFASLRLDQVERIAEDGKVIG